MQPTNDCLQNAMFIASESYSGSSYETDLLQSMNTNCEDVPVITNENDAPAMAA